MDNTSQKPQLTSLLSNATLDRLHRLRIVPIRKLTNLNRGEHYAGKEGTSTEFADYRDYAPGDDMRFVDWNAFSRLHRPYLKLYHREEQRHVVILVDASTSMLFEDKLGRAKQIAAALGVIALQNNERVSVYVSRKLQEGMPQRMPPSSGRANMKKLFTFLEGIEGGGNEPLEHGIEQVLKYHSGRGSCLVLSDFLTFGDMTRAFNLLFSTGLELLGVQLLGPTELNPEITGDLRFVDSETQQTLDVSSAADLLAIYQEYRVAHEQQVATLCQKRAGRFLSISSQETVESVVFDLMRRKGWIA
jgi:uncharacterized protein (DUF58 family)